MPWPSPQFNRRLTQEGRPYILVGVGRWGSTHSWLGIPVRWADISGAQVIVEAGFKDFRVTPSQGTHFFQNLTSLNIGYFTVNQEMGEGFVDWDWLADQPAVDEIGPGPAPPVRGPRVGDHERNHPEGDHPEAQPFKQSVSITAEAGRGSWRLPGSNPLA